MGAQLVEFNGSSEPATFEGIMIDQPLEWYKVVGIELLLFAATVVTLAVGALLAR